MSNSQKLFEITLKLFFTHQLQLKMYHFQTKKYGAHKTIDAYLEKFENNLDKFMETAQGIFGKLETNFINLNIKTATDNNIISELDKFIKILKMFDDKLKSHTDLLNIRDEILADIDQLKYLLTFA